MLYIEKNYYYNSKTSIYKIELVLIIRSQATLLRIIRVEENTFKIYLKSN